MINSPSSTASQLRQQSEVEAGALPPLLVQAQQLAASVQIGEHGRRRAGLGDDFWQYRPMQQGDSRRMIDYRRSARGDQQFVRERELQIAQSVHLWVDQGASMRFASSDQLPQKIQRARLLGLSLSILMLRAGERVGLTGGTLPPRPGNLQILHLAEALSQDQAADYAPPEDRAMSPHAKAVFISDFLGPSEPVEQALSKAAQRGVHGVLFQVLDPSEELFPFAGRTRFESVSKALVHETLKASDLRERYLQKLAERRETLQKLCRASGWVMGQHRSDQSPLSALMWLFQAMSGHST
ncbi:hypothetical protein RSK20926_07507 [Roseobacter sp. SK209-2-6]|uniref:DUF58 domain-containing protein n=1 Tax=Roseobacter sp. SK209-2-6 TaxID=388739 RepID=UPI0000F3D825|nr:DUF58 domain-containing protein [Roseobacter sp. SK209-2-6]EBA17566.1 hypothetical protein RSK20926_07507 [Roseobacter sp. SK209-2-6]